MHKYTLTHTQTQTDKKNIQPTNFHVQALPIYPTHIDPYTESAVYFHAHITLSGESEKKNNSQFLRAMHYSNTTDQK